MDAAQRQPWERCKGEGEKPFAAFCRYLDLGTQRSIHQAVKDFLTETSQPYRKSVYDWWRQWAGRWKWRDRAQAFDDYKEYVARKAEVEAEAAARAADAEDRVQQRKLLTEEAKGIRTIARLLAARILEVLSDPAKLRTLELHRVKTVVATDPLNRTETVTPGVLDLVKLAGDGLKVGSELYRVAQLDQPDEDGQPKTAERKAQEIATVLTGRLLEMSLDEMLVLRDELIRLNGKAAVE